MARKVPPAFRRLPTPGERATVSQPGIPEFITVEVAPQEGAEKQTVVYVRRDTLPKGLQEAINQEIVTKVVGLDLWENQRLFGNIGLRKIED